MFVDFQDKNGSIENEELHGFFKDLLSLIKEVGFMFILHHKECFYLILKAVIASFKEVFITKNISHS